MPEVCYVAKKFSEDHENIIAHTNNICIEYFSQGMVLTLRQLYYQFVSRGLMENSQANYNKLQRVTTDARLAGRLDWDFLIDRTRNEISRPNWKNAGKILESATESFHTDLWANQGVRPILFVEKDAAIGVVDRVCHDNDVPYLSCRGYLSWSELWSAAQRIRFHIENGDRVVILHIGDHDPSGVHMTDDMNARLKKVLYKDWYLTWGRSLRSPVSGVIIKAHMLAHMAEVRQSYNVTGPPFMIKRIALNRDQVLRYDPPPNFAKTTDPRFKSYFDSTGLDESWELDSLEPNVLINLIQDEISGLRDDAKWTQALAERERERMILSSITKFYTPVVELATRLREEANNHG